MSVQDYSSRFSQAIKHAYERKTRANDDTENDDTESDDLEPSSGWIMLLLVACALITLLWSFLLGWYTVKLVRGLAAWLWP